MGEKSAPWSVDVPFCRRGWRAGLNPGRSPPQETDGVHRPYPEKPRAAMHAGRWESQAKINVRLACRRSHAAPPAAACPPQKAADAAARPPRTRPPPPIQPQKLPVGEEFYNPGCFAPSLMSRGHWERGGYMRLPRGLHEARWEGGRLEDGVWERRAAVAHEGKPRGGTFRRAPAARAGPEEWPVEGRPLGARQGRGRWARAGRRCGGRLLPLRCAQLQLRELTAETRLRANAGPANEDRRHVGGWEARAEVARQPPVDGHPHRWVRSWAHTPEPLTFLFARRVHSLDLLRLSARWSKVSGNGGGCGGPVVSEELHRGRWEAQGADAARAAGGAPGSTAWTGAGRWEARVAAGQGPLPLPAQQGSAVHLTRLAPCAPAAVCADSCPGRRCSLR